MFLIHKFPLVGVQLLGGMSTKGVNLERILQPEPEYDFVTHFVCLTIRFKSPLTPRLSGDKVNDNRNDNRNDRPNNSRIDRLSDSVKKTYQIIKDNPGLQRKEISELAGKSIPTIDRHLAVLIKKELIEHRYSDRTGGYYAK